MKSLLTLLASLVFLCAHTFGSNTTKPNITFLLVDDLGGGDLHCYGHPYSRAPKIDSLAKDGTRLMQFYATGCASIK